MANRIRQTVSKQAEWQTGKRQLAEKVLLLLLLLCGKKTWQLQIAVPLLPLMLVMCCAGIH